MSLLHPNPKKPKEHDVTCPCGARMRLIWGEKFKRWFYGCSEFPKCKNVHGAHPDGRPLGDPGDEETRRLRQALHAELDKWYPVGSYSQYCLRSRFLHQATGLYHVADLNKGQLTKLLKQLEAKTDTS